MSIITGAPGYFTDIRQDLASNDTVLQYVESTGIQYIDIRGSIDIEAVDTSKFNYIKITSEYVKINNNVQNINSNGFSSNTLILFGGVSINSTNKDGTGKLGYCKISCGRISCIQN